MHFRDPVRPRPERRRSRAPRGRATAAVVVVAVLALVATGCVKKYQPSERGWSLPSGTVSGAEVRSRAGLAPGVEILWESTADQNADFAAVAATGAKWVTLDVDWNSIQGDGPTSFRWDRAMDRAVGSARSHGLSIIGVAAYSPPWARPSHCPRGELHCLPANPNDYGRFLAAAAARYGSRSTNAMLRGSITTWQLWNEPNHQEFAQPKPDLDVYAAMVKSAYLGVKAVDPSATVIMGGMAPAPDAADGTDYQPETFLEAMYARGTKHYFDAVGHHPYAYPFNPLEPQTWNAYTQTFALHLIMQKHGDGNKKIWGTEVGAPTGTDTKALSDAKQAQWVHDYYLGWNTVYRAFTGPLVWMPVRDSGTNAGHRWENMGLLKRDRTAKPAYNTYRMLMFGGI